MPETTTELRACQHCDRFISRLGGEWTDLDGCVVCDENTASVTAGHQPVCPPSAVADLILPWNEVGEGDLVLWDGEFRLITRKFDYCGEPLMWFDGSKLGPGTIPAGTYAAVRRYVTED